ncbi:MAG: hypothetical protein GQ535_04725 [Rhodobacteraceae bacterium]|nr:hypothetical protein [Paracoccaceae bacterium]
MRDIEDMVPHGSVDLDSDMEVLLACVAKGSMSVAEARFELKSVFGQLLRTTSIIMAHAPEGIGKTTAMMELISKRVFELIREELFVLEEDSHPSIREKY